MATNAPDALVWLATEWERAIDTAEKRNDAATISGVIGDIAHRRSGGYHISRDDQPASNYSVADCPPDRKGQATMASAIDMSMLPRDMTLVTGRLHASWADRADPRLDHCRGINGTVDGHTPIRFDCQFHTTEPATADHLWHIHLEVLRQYNGDMATMRDILSVIVGAANAPAAPVTARTEEDRMFHEPIPLGSGKGVECGFPFDTGDNPGLSISTDTGPSGRAKATWRIAKHTASGWTVVTVTTNTQDVRRLDVPLDHGTDRVTVTRVALDATDTCDILASVLCWW